MGKNPTCCVGGWLEGSVSSIFSAEGTTELEGLWWPMKRSFYLVISPSLWVWLIGRNWCQKTLMCYSSLVPLMLFLAVTQQPPSSCQGCWMCCCGDCKHATTVQQRQPGSLYRAQRCSLIWCLSKDGVCLCLRYVHVSFSLSRSRLACILNMYWVRGCWYSSLELCHEFQT